MAVQLVLGIIFMLNLLGSFVKAQSACAEITEDFRCRWSRSPRCRWEAGASPECQAFPCDSQPCTNNGVCIEQGNSYYCSCAAGWTGQRCELKKPIQESVVSSGCSRAECSGNGDCLLSRDEDGYYCVCDQGYTGDYCQFTQTKNFGLACAEIREEASCPSSRCSWQAEKFFGRFWAECRDKACAEITEKASCPRSRCKWQAGASAPCQDKACAEITEKASCPRSRCKWQAGASDPCLDKDLPIWTNRGNSGGARCINTCTMGPDGPWCYTTKFNYNRKWGFCDLTVWTTGGNSERGARCVFPFLYKGKLRHTCTTINHDKPWCATTTTFSRDGKWGDCVFNG